MSNLESEELEEQTNGWKWAKNASNSAKVHKFPQNFSKIVEFFQKSSKFFQDSPENAQNASNYGAMWSILLFQALQPPKRFLLPTQRAQIIQNSSIFPLPFHFYVVVVVVVCHLHILMIEFLLASAASLSWMGFCREKTK